MLPTNNSNVDMGFVTSDFLVFSSLAKHATLKLPAVHACVLELVLYDPLGELVIGYKAISNK